MNPVIVLLSDAKEGWDRAPVLDAGGEEGASVPASARRGRECEMEHRDELAMLRLAIRGREVGSSGRRDMAGL